MQTELGTHTTKLSTLSNYMWHCKIERTLKFIITESICRQNWAHLLQIWAHWFFLWQRAYADKIGHTNVIKEWAHSDWRITMCMCGQNLTQLLQIWAQNEISHNRE